MRSAQHYREPTWSRQVALAVDHGIVVEMSETVAASLLGLADFIRWRHDGGAPSPSRVSAPSLVLCRSRCLRHDLWVIKNKNPSAKAASGFLSPRLTWG